MVVDFICLFIYSLFNVDDIFIKYKLKILIAVQRACMLINVNHTKYLYLKTFYKINEKKKKKLWIKNILTDFRKNDHGSFPMITSKGRSFRCFQGV